MNEAERLVSIVSDPLEFYSADDLRLKGFDRNYRRRLERDDFKLAKVSYSGDLSYLGGYLIGRALKERIGIKKLLKGKPKTFSHVCPFAFCSAMQIHPDELPETISPDGKNTSLVERVQVGSNISYRVPVQNMAYISLPLIEDILLEKMSNEELVRRHRVSGDEKYRDEFLARYDKTVRQIIESSDSFCVALKQMGYQVLEHYAKKGASEGFSRFDMTRGISLTTYLPQRVKGEVLDYLRDIDEVPRNIRSAQKAMRPFVEDAKKNGHPFDIEAFIKEKGVTKDTAYLAYDLFRREQGHTRSLDEKQWETDSYKEVRLKDSLIIDVPVGKDSIKMIDMKDGISRLLSGLDPIEREIIVAYFLDDAKMKSLGESLDLSESRVSQMIHGTNGEGGILSRLRNNAARIFPEYVPRELKKLFPDMD